MSKELARTLRSEWAAWFFALVAALFVGVAFLDPWGFEDSRSPPVIVIVDNNPQGEFVLDTTVANSLAGDAQDPAGICIGTPTQSGLYAPIGESSADFLQMTRAVIMPLASGEKGVPLSLVQSVPPQFLGGDTAASAAMRPSPVLSTQGIIPTAS